MKSIFNKFLLVLSSLIGGGTACTSVFEGADEYGCPHADYIVRGNVVDESTKEPIAGADVIVSRGNRNYHGEETDTVQTNEKGVFVDAWSTSCGLYDNVTIDTDVEGYEKSTMEVNLKDVAYVGKHDWYEGKKEKSVTIELKKKQ